MKLAFLQGETAGPAAAVMVYQSNRAVIRAPRIDAIRAREIEDSFRRRAVMAAERFRDQSPEPGGAAVLQKTIQDLERGTPDYAAMSLALADKLRRHA